jgi:hypothetical protein
MRIKKVYQGTIPSNKIVNTYTETNTDTYSCEYLNDHLGGYPVGAIYISANSTSPASLFGGVWEQISGRTLIGAGKPSQNSNTNYGTLTSDELNYDFIAGQTLGEYLHDHQYGFRSRGWYGTMYEGFELYNGVTGIWEGAGGSVGPGNTTVANFGDAIKAGNAQYLTRQTNTTRQYGIMPSLVVYMWKRVS